MNQRTHEVRCGILAAGLMTLCACSGAGADVPVSTERSAASPGAIFGVACQETFQNNWRKPLSYVWSNCQGFIDQLSPTDHEGFYYNLHGMKPGLEKTDDQDVAETVDLLFVETHGGASKDGSSARYVMWDQDTRAYTGNMALGNEGHGLSTLSTYSCDTLYNGDNGRNKRWRPVFNGGMRYLTGGWDLMYAGWTTDDTGQDYAADLQDGLGFMWAWADGTWDWYVTNHPAVLTTGTDSFDCVNREFLMSWTNFDSWPRLTTGNYHKFCATRWTF